MARESIVPKELIIRDRRSGMKVREIGTKYDVAVGYVTAVLTRAGETVNPRVLPREWGTIATEDANSFHLQRLRWALAVDGGKDLTREEMGKLRPWLAEIERRDSVVWYSRDTGAILVPRAEGDAKYWTVADWPEVQRRLRDAGLA